MGGRPFDLELILLHPSTEQGSRSLGRAHRVGLMQLSPSPAGTIWEVRQLEPERWAESREGRVQYPEVKAKPSLWVCFGNENP